MLEQKNCNLSHLEEIKQNTEKYTIELTKIPSAVETSGELDIAWHLYNTLKEEPYFIDHPDQLYFQKCDGEDERHNVVAYVKGGKGEYKNTVVLLGHIDTVGIEDYRDLKHIATDPMALAEALKEMSIPEEAKKDLDSGEWLFGRGIFDMKCGVAANLSHTLQAARNPELFKGNIIFLGVPDEEGNSAGMLSALKLLNKIKDQDKLVYNAVLDTDYMTSRYEGDENRYIYVGTIGKLLPSFYIVGKESHVGQSFDGLDPNELSAELVREINLSHDLCDVADGEVTVPPITLKQRDLKVDYSVQIAKSAHLYFNYATHGSEPDEVMSKLVSKAEKAFDTVVERLNNHYKHYCEMSEIPHTPLPWKTKVYTFDALYRKVAEELGYKLHQRIAALQRRLDPNTMDDRAYSLAIVEEVCKMNPDPDPMIVVFFAPPYYPHMYINGKNDQEQKLLDALNHSAELVQPKIQEPLKLRKFYPYISDLSFCSVTENQAIIDKLITNMPAWPEKYELPIDEMREFNVPVANIGPFGKDAHQFTERLHRPFSFDVMPELLFETIKYLLEK
ncbi:M20/M25/M40 family metallo-hydrolase [Tindallia californiensis]|uniref:Arginine utilization protein RocB n=1 Tax=Tindallia californiensis TaxID=159292 RepID=A0A1H3NG95_9FIRM|nr:M20/M25/M40 family metallo-hydrolase [Tindallia californiensis]SDY87898.1 Arginine utilization protein RocB [Tindallia californiensis]